MAESTPPIDIDDQTGEITFTPRQKAVLDCALHLLVAGGEKGLTTAGLARKANCSKESLYKWFGDRNGLLAAVVHYQASQVAFEHGSAATDADSFRQHLTDFTRDLLLVLHGETSLALNRLAIGQSNNKDSRLGHLLLVRGKYMIRARAKALLEVGHFRGFLKFDDAEDAYQVLYGLAVRDTHIRLLLGEAPEAGNTDSDGQAHIAVDRFYRLFGA